MSDSTTSALSAAEAARAYLISGYQPIPIPPGAKKPWLDEWPIRRFGADQVDLLFPTGHGVGLILGAADIGNLVDVDLDSAEAVAVAEMFLPPTGWIHGRPGNPRSHHWYVCNPAPEKTTQHRDPIDRSVIVELRSLGAQTNVPPTVHPSGEQLAWAAFTSPAKVAASDLTIAVAHLAVAALFTKYWPGQGGRHDAALAVAGMLFGAGVSLTDAERIVRAAATAAHDDDIEDRVRCVTDTHTKIAAGEPTLGVARLIEIMGQPVVGAVHKMLGVRMSGKGRGKTGARASSRPNSEVVLALTTELELFHDSSKQAFASYTRDGQRETIRIPSSTASDFLRHLCYQTHGATPSTRSLDECIDMLRAKAIYDGPMASVHYRIAHVESTMYVDLGDVERTIIEIDAQGWREAANCPIPFERPSSMQPLPIPIRGGSVDELRRFVNTADETAWRLLLIGIIGAYRATGPFAVMSFQGPYGSAKSTAAEEIRSLVDPAVPALRSAPRNEDDLMIAASRSHLLVFDNLSKIDSWLSDAMCRIATGGGFGKRQLYSDADEIILNVERPMIITSIEEVITRGDLLDRALIIELQAISPTARKPLKVVRSEFAAARPAILGALLDAISTALRREPTVALAELPRLADAARWACAAAPALGLDERAILDALSNSRRSSHGVALGSWIASRSVLDLLQRVPSWHGMPTELLHELTSGADPSLTAGRHWPTTPSALTNKLKNLAPDFAALGIDVEFSRTGTARLVTLTRNTQHVVIAVTTVTDDPPNDGDDDHDGGEFDSYDECDAAEAASFRASLGDADNSEIF